MGAEVLVGKEVIGLTRDVMNCMKEYAVCKQEEITERKRIKAQLTAITKMIDAKEWIVVPSSVSMTFSSVVAVLCVRTGFNN